MFEDQPKPLIEMVLKAVMIIIGEEETWTAAQKAMEDPKFLERLKAITYGDMDQSKMHKLSFYCRKAHFNKHDLAPHSAAAAFLAEWVLNLESKGTEKKELPPVVEQPKLSAKDRLEYKRILQAQKQAEQVEYELHKAKME